MNEFNYPLYFIAKNTMDLAVPCVVEFTGLREGTIVQECSEASGGRIGFLNKTGYSSIAWTKHTDSSSWVPTTDPRKPKHIIYI